MGSPIIFYLPKYFLAYTKPNSPHALASYNTRESKYTPCMKISSLDSTLSHSATANSPSQRHQLSESQEDYLKEIFKLAEQHKIVSLQMLTRKMKVKSASVTGMVKKLEGMGLVAYEPYKEVRLTKIGEAIALEVLRHHRLLELFLADHLNYSWDEIHEEAERLEHVISEKFEAAISELMGHPTHDPHGDPIPTADLTLPDTPPLIAVSKVRSSGMVTIRRVMTQDRDMLNMLARLNLVIGQTLEILALEEAGVRLQVEENRYLLPYAMAGIVLVESA